MLSQHTAVCRICTPPLSGHQTAYCSRACSRAGRKAHFGIPDHQLPTGTVGALHEILVCADLMRRGWHVFRAMSPACPCDLVAYRDGQNPIRFEVRTAHRGPGGRLYDPVRRKHEGPARHDVLACVEHDGTITYDPPMKEPKAP